MPANWDVALKNLLEIEGGFSARDNARGPVNMGVTGYFLGLIGRPNSIDDVRALTREDVAEIYRFYFWVRYNIRDINSQRVAEAVLKCMVNTDPQEVILAIHGALEAIGRPVISPTIPKRVRVLGPVTVSAINSLGVEGEAAFMEEFKSRMRVWYRALGRANLQEFGDDQKGWISRVAGL